MAITVTGCAITNVVPDSGGNIAARYFSLRLSATSSGEIAAGGPYNIVVKDSGNNVVSNWTFVTVSSSIGQSTISPDVSPIQAPAGNYTAEVYAVGLGLTMVLPLVMTDNDSLATASYLISLTAPCALGTGNVNFTLGGPVPETYELYSSSYVLVDSGVVVGSTLNLTGLTPDSYFIRFNFTTVCDVPVYGVAPGNNVMRVSFTVNATNIPIDATAEVVSEDCLAANGSITVTPTNGTGPYTYVFSFYDTKISQWVPVESLLNSAYNLVTGTYQVDITDANGCTGTLTVIVNLVPGTCGGCYSLTDCFPGAQGSPTYYVYGDALNGLDGYIINGAVVTGQYIDPNKCWLVTAIDGANVVCATSLPLESFNNFYSECEPCKYIAPVPELPPTHSVNEPVEIFYQIAESECDIKVVKQFANGYFSLVKKLKYGISDCCKATDLAELWTNKQISDLDEIVIPGYECRSTPNNGCGWLPLATCEIIPDTSGGTSILAIAGEDILFGKLVMLSTDGKLYLNDPTSATTYQRCIGFTTMDVLKNQTVRVLIMGLFTNVNWSLTSGNIYYANSTGNITSTIPVNPPLAISQMVGTATSSTTLLVDIKQPNII